MPTYCSVYGCHNSTRTKYHPSGDNADLSFHIFPLKYPKVLRKWLKRINRPNFNPTRFNVICSVHFEQSCFFVQKNGRKVLNPKAVPTLLLYSDLDRAEEQPKGKPSVEIVKLAEKFKKYFGSLDNNTQDDNNIEDEEVVTDESGSSSDEDSDIDSVPLEKFLSDNLPDHSKNFPIEEKIESMKTKLMSTVMKRALKRALIESEIKAAHATRDYYESKKSFLSPKNALKKRGSKTVSFTDVKSFEDLKIQVMEEELASATEKRVLQKELYEAQVEATTSKRRYYSSKKCHLLKFRDA